MNQLTDLFLIFVADNRYEQSWSADSDVLGQVNVDVQSIAERPLIAPRVPRLMAGKIQLKQSEPMIFV